MFKLQLIKIIAGVSQLFNSFKVTERDQNEISADQTLDSKNYKWS
jgi:hypothetical protein